MEKRNNLIKKNIFVLLLVFSQLIGCYDRFHSPALISGFYVPIKIKEKIKGKDLKITETINTYYPGMILWFMTSGNEFVNIAVYKDNELLFEFDEDVLKNKLATLKKGQEVFWLVDENGLSLIDYKKAHKINEFLEKIRKKIVSKKIVSEDDK